MRHLLFIALAFIGGCLVTGCATAKRQAEFERAETAKALGDRAKDLPES